MLAKFGVWIFRGGLSRRRRGCRVDIPRMRVAATPRVPRGYSVEACRGDAAGYSVEACRGDAADAARAGQGVAHRTGRHQPLPPGRCGSARVLLPNRLRLHAAVDERRRRHRQGHREDVVRGPADELLRDGRAGGPDEGRLALCGSSSGIASTPRRFVGRGGLVSHRSGSAARSRRRRSTPATAASSSNKSSP